MKRTRQNKIIEIIENNEIATQEALKAMLEAEGITVTQATLSRDINELCLRKEMSPSGAYIYVRRQRGEADFPPIFRDAITGTDHALNTVVIKCSAGTAQAVCAALDKMERPDIVGTIAGDDTIFALMRTEAAAAELSEDLMAFEE